MKRRQRVFAPWVYVLTVGAGVLIVAILWLSGELERREVALGFLALISSFFGAQFAFRLGESRDEEKERRRRVSAINRALLVLGAQHNEIRTMKRELDKFPQDVECALSMNAHMPPDSIGWEQRLDDLDFLIESDDPNMLFKLHVEQLRFDQALVSVRFRAKQCIEELQPAFEASDLMRTNAYSWDALRAGLGERILEAAVNMVSTMRMHVYGSNVSIPELQTELMALGKSMFPDAKLIKFELVDDVPPLFDPRDHLPQKAQRSPEQGNA